ncbi:hypothetical protein D3C77_603780 [compost metagenome]
MSNEDTIFKQPPVLAQGAGKWLAWQIGRQALRQAQGNGEGTQSAEQGQRNKDRLPAIDIDQHPSQHRGEDGSQAHHQYQLGEHLGRCHGIAFVTDNCPRQHHAGAPAQRLDESCRDQRLKVRGQSAGN